MTTAISNRKKAPEKGEMNLVDLPTETFNTLSAQAANVARRIVGPQDADDVAMGAMMRFWRAGERVQPNGAIGYIRRIAYNEAIDLLRRNKNAAPMSLDAPIREGSDVTTFKETLPDDPTTRPAARLIQRQQAVDALKAIGTIPEVYREALVMKDVEGMSYEDIGAELGITVGTVRSRLHRGRKLIQKYLAEHGEDAPNLELGQKSPLTKSEIKEAFMILSDHFDGDRSKFGVDAGYDASVKPKRGLGYYERVLRNIYTTLAETDLFDGKWNAAMNASLPPLRR